MGRPRIYLTKEAQQARRKVTKKAWNLAHPTYSSDYKKAHPKEHTEATKKWKKANPAYDKEWNNTNRPKVRVISRRWKLNNPEAATTWYRNKYEKLAGRPKPKKCEVCKRGGTICFDHCHKSKKFRGWICHKCNITLGFMNDSPELLRKLAKYLVKAKKSR